MKPAGGAVFGKVFSRFPLVFHSIFTLVPPLFPLCFVPVFETVKTEAWETFYGLPCVGVPGFTASEIRTTRTWDVSGSLLLEGL